ncbi:MAG: hypothetical protein JO108_20455 [Acidobacteriaceae bacterium]|nr:hypothetical protein [Acidobacteriaceae bacterium]
MFLSVTPVPPILPPALLKVGARAPYVFGLLVSHSGLAIVLVAVTLELLNLAFVRQAHFGPLAVAKSVLISILAPLVVGTRCGTSDRHARENWHISSECWER